MSKIVYIVTAPMTVELLLRGQLKALSQQGFDVTAVTAPDSNLDAVAQREGVEILAVPMQREISLFKDLRSLFLLYRLLCRLQPDIVNASTPKAALLGMIAAWLARVPIRIYVLRGLRLETTTGAQRLVLGITERITAACAHHIVCVGDSLRHAYRRLDITSAEKLTVLGSGTSNGVIVERFLSNEKRDAEAEHLQMQLGLPSDVPVIGFVGRLTRDKGIVDLISAFEKVLQALPDAHLLLIGQFEEGDPVPDYIRDQIETHRQIKLTGWVSDTSPYYHLMTLLALPSYREGFPNVPLEAAAAGIPTVGFSATGVVDAIQNCQTGFVVPIGDVDKLADALVRLLADSGLCNSFGNKAQAWVTENFASEKVWQQWISYYYECIKVIDTQHHTQD